MLYCGYFSLDPATCQWVFFRVHTDCQTLNFHTRVRSSIVVFLTLLSYWLFFHTDCHYRKQFQVVSRWVSRRTSHSLSWTIENFKLKKWSLSLLPSLPSIYVQPEGFSKFIRSMPVKAAASCIFSFFHAWHIYLDLHDQGHTKMWTWQRTSAKGTQVTSDSDVWVSKCRHILMNLGWPLTTWPHDQVRSTLIFFFQTLNWTWEDDVSANSKSYYSKEVLVALVFLIVSAEFLTSISPQLLRVSEVRNTRPIKTVDRKYEADIRSYLIWTNCILSDKLLLSRRVWAIFAYFYLKSRRQTLSGLAFIVKFQVKYSTFLSPLWRLWSIRDRETE